VLAAGGIATGRGIAGVLAMGAAGAWIGTRFAATREALGSTAAKQAILTASERDTIHTHVFDIVQRIPWPDAFPGRALKNAFAERWHGREDALRAQLAEVSPAFEAARARGDYGEMYVYAGQAVGLIRDVPAAGELVERLVAETVAVLARSRRLLSDTADAGAEVG
jgi:nitronate monooxygenase